MLVVHSLNTPLNALGPAFNTRTKQYTGSCSSWLGAEYVSSFSICLGKWRKEFELYQNKYLMQLESKVQRVSLQLSL